MTQTAKPLPTRWTPFGDMNKRMLVFSRDETPTDSGGMEGTPTQLLALQVKLTPMRGTEKFQAGCQMRALTHRINCVYQGGINGKMYGTWDDRTFEFTSVVNIDEENRELEILAIENIT